VSENNTSGPFQEAQFQVSDTNPVWVYCRQANHCQLGMVFAINPGSQFAAFQANAMGNTSTSASPVSTPAVAPTATSPATVSTPSSSTSQDHRIIVGGTNILAFQPANITAQPGDTITFEFHQKNHTVTQSSFAAPCQMLASTSTSGQIGFDSGLYVVVPFISCASHSLMYMFRQHARRYKRYHVPHIHRPGE
jgi:plastocyanin